MAIVKLGPLEVSTSGELPAPGTLINFILTGKDLQDKTRADFPGKYLVLNIFPSVDTGVCAQSVREFNHRANLVPGVAILCISKDLPFAQTRFCGAEGLNNVFMLSEYRSEDFSRNNGLLLVSGPFKGLMTRAILVLDPEGKVIHSQLVPAIDQEPDYDGALQAISRG